MNTTITTNVITARAKKIKVRLIDTQKLFASLEANRFGVTPAFLVFVVCLGGIAGAVAIQFSWMMLALVLLPAGFVEALLIAIAPMRTICWFVLLSVFIDLFVFFM